MSAASDSTSDADLTWRKTQAGTEHGSGLYTGHLTGYGTACGRFKAVKDDERSGHGHFWVYHEGKKLGPKFQKLKDAKAHCEAVVRSGGVMEEIDKEIDRLHVERDEQRGNAAFQVMHGLLSEFEGLEAEVRGIDFDSDNAHDEVIIGLDRRIEHYRSHKESGDLAGKYVLGVYEERLTDLRDRLVAADFASRQANGNDVEVSG